MSVEAVTISNGQQSVTLTPETGRRIDEYLRREVRPPAEEAFGEDDFCAAPDLESLAQHLIGKDLRFSHLGAFRFEQLLADRRRVVWEDAARRYVASNPSDSVIAWQSYPRQGIFVGLAGGVWHPNGRELA